MTTMILLLKISCNHGVTKAIKKKFLAATNSTRSILVRHRLVVIVTIFNKESTRDKRNMKVFFYIPVLYLFHFFVYFILKRQGLG